MVAALPNDILLVALGGNALIREGQVGTIEEPFANRHAPLRQVARLSRHYRILMTYGKGPQVGHLLVAGDGFCGDLLWRRRYFREPRRARLSRG